MPRKLGDWVSTFEDISAYSGSPLRFRKWAAIACIAGALEQKVWVHTKNDPFYPGLYTVLVGPPGVGKSFVLKLVRALWKSLPDHKFGSTSVSKASLADDLNDAQRTIIRPGKSPPTVEFNTALYVVSELGVFLPEYSNDFMNVLTDLYDNIPYTERKRTKNLTIDIPRPQLNFITGTTPSYLNTLLPDGAWDQGFLSRTFLVYEGQQVLTSLFTNTETDADLYKKLEADLHEISELYGEITFSEEAMSFIDTWYLGGQAPKPTHPKLQHYLTRRAGHLLKLCQVACVSTGNKLEITLQHVQTALDWLVDMESAIPDIFKSMFSGGDSRIMEEAWHMLFQYKAKMQKGAPSSVLIAFLSQKTPAHNVERLIDLMEKSNMIRAVGEKNIGTVYYAKERNAV